MTPQRAQTWLLPRKSPRPPANACSRKPPLRKRSTLHSSSHRSRCLPGHTDVPHSCSPSTATQPSANQCLQSLVRDRFLRSPVTPPRGWDNWHPSKAPFGGATRGPFNARTTVPRYFPCLSRFSSSCEKNFPQRTRRTFEASSSHHSRRCAKRQPFPSTIPPLQIRRWWCMKHCCVFITCGIACESGLRMEHFQSIIPQRPHHPSLLISRSTLRRSDGGVWLAFGLALAGGNWGGLLDVDA